MKQELRERLERLSRAEVDELYVEICGAPARPLRTKAAVIDALMLKRRRVEERIGIERTWFDRHSSHVYGIIGVLGVVLALALWVIDRRSAVPDRPVIGEDTRRDVEAQIQAVLDAEPLVQTAPGENQVVNVESVPEILADAFEIIEHSIVLDLRPHNRLAPVDRAEFKSAAVQTVQQRVRKINDSPVYRMTATTSGLDVFARSQDSREIMLYASDERTNVAGYIVKPRIIEVNVANVPVGESFLVEVGKTYWNAFQDDAQSWAGLNADVNTGKIEYLVIFPSDRPFTDFEFISQPPEGAPIHLNNEQYVLKDSEGRWLWWRVNYPQAGYDYLLDWEW